MVVPADADAAARLRSERNQGRAPDMGWVDHERLGFNYRLTEMQAALGVAQLERADELLAGARRVAAAVHGAARRSPAPRRRARATRRARAAVRATAAPSAAAGSSTPCACPRARRPRRRRRRPRAARDRRRRRTCRASTCSQPYRERFGHRPGELPVAEDASERLLALPFFPADRPRRRSSAAARRSRRRSRGTGPDDALMARLPDPQDELFRRLNTLDRVRPPAVAAGHRRLDALTSRRCAAPACSATTRPTQLDEGLERGRGELERGEFEFAADDEDIHMAVERRLTELVGAGRRQAPHRAFAQRPGGDRHARSTSRERSGAAVELLAALMAAAAERWPRATPTGRCPATRTSSAPSPSTSAITCSPTSGCSRRDAAPVRGRALGRRGRWRWARAPWRARTGSSTARATAERLGFDRPSPELDRRGRQPRLRPRVPGRGGDLRDPPLAPGRGAGALVEPGVRVLRARRRLLLWLEPDAAEEEPRRGRAAAREGAAHRRRLHDPRRASCTRLPLAYSKDLQEDKEAAVRRGRQPRAVAARRGGDARRPALRPRAPRGGGRPTSSWRATEVADLLVRRGMPFREAHGVVGGLVREALERGVALSELEPRRARRALRAARRRVLRGADVGVGARVQARRGRDVVGAGGRAARRPRGRRSPRSSAAGMSGPPSRPRPASCSAPSFFERAVHAVARELIGCSLLLRRRRRRDRRDRELRARRSRLPRLRRPNGRGPRCCSARPAHAYVYLSYGIHSLLNFVCEPEGERRRGADQGAGAAVGGRARCGAGAASTTRGPVRGPREAHARRSASGSSSNRAPLDGAAVRAARPRGGWRDVGGRRRPADRDHEAVELPWRFCAAGSDVPLAPGG